MAVTKLYPAQVTMMTTHEQKRWIKEQSEAAAARGVSRSESQVCREIFAAGKRLEILAAGNGWTVEELLDGFEAQIEAQVKARETVEGA